MWVNPRLTRFQSDCFHCFCVISVIKSAWNLPATLLTTLTFVIVVHHTSHIRCLADHHSTRPICASLVIKKLIGDAISLLTTAHKLSNRQSTRLSILFWRTHYVAQTWSLFLINVCSEHDHGVKCFTLLCNRPNRLWFSIFHGGYSHFCY